MKRFWIVIVLVCAIPYVGYAEVMELRSGKLVQGTVVLQNDDVVIMQTSDGLKHQYPRSEVISLRMENSSSDSVAANPIGATNNTKKVALMIDGMGGLAMLPSDIMGGTMLANMTIGSHQILGHRILLGGGFGYHSYWLGGRNFGYIPLQFVAMIPLLDKDNAPAIGMRLGYAFSSKAAYSGGMTAGLDVSWWHKMNDRSSLILGVHTSWQQTQMTRTELVNNVAYSTYRGRNILTVGLKIGLQF